MSTENILQILFFICFFGFIATFLHGRLKFGSFKAAMFGAPIRSTVGEVKGSGSKIATIAIKVHKLAGKPSEKAVGLELVGKTIGSYEMYPVALSVQEAERLISLLQSAVGNKQSVTNSANSQETNVT